MPNRILKSWLCLLLISQSLSSATAFAATREFEGSVQTSELQGGAEDDWDRGIIGIRFIAVDSFGTNFVVIQKVVKNGPAFLAGLKRGDRIVAVDGTSLKRMNRFQIVSKLKGDPGSVVNLSIKRGTTLLEIPVQRGGLTNLPDPHFKAEFLVQDTTEERELRIRLMSQTLLLSAASRASASVNSAIPLENRIRAKNYCDSSRFFLDTNRCQEAIQALRHAVKADPEFLELQFLQGLLLDKLKKYPEAQALLQKCVAERPGATDGWLALAGCFQNQGKLSDAIAALKKSCALSTDQAEESKLRARIGELTQQLARASATTATSTSVTPEPSSEPETVLADETASTHQTELLLQAVEAIKIKDYDAALPKLNELIASKTCPIGAWKLLGVAAQAKDEVPRATEAYKIYLNAAKDNPVVAEDPDLAAMYLNLAQCQHEAGKLADVVTSLETGLQHKPSTEQEFYASQMIGSVKLRMGKFSESAASLTQAIQAAPKDTDTSEIQELVKLLESLNPSRAGNAEDDSYFRALKKDRIERWNRRRPLKVYIADGSAVPGFKEEYAKILRNSFDTWSTVADGLVAFKYVEKPKSADIECTWVDDPSTLGGTFRGGLTRTSTFGHEITKAKIQILTMQKLKTVPPVTASAIQTVTLHEIGHALGLRLHSNNPNDIMFFFALAANLSERDKNTLRTLYETPLSKESILSWPYDPKLQQQR